VGLACFGNSEVSTLEIDEEAWARDYFQVASDKVQERLAQYLILPDIRTTMPPDIKSADTAEQLAWATDKAVQELSAFVAKELSRLAAWDITSGHSDPDTAATIVQHFRKGSSHAVDRWSNASTALAIMTAMFTALGLNKSETDLDSIVTAVLRAMDIAEGKPGRSPEQYEQDSNSLHAQNYSHLDPAGMDMFQQATDEDSSLRRASIVTQQWLYVFDLDGKPTCKIFSPFASSYKVRLESDGQPCKSSQVKDAAWLRVLGKDPLPIAVLQSRLYSTHNISVVLKSQGLYHICNASPDIATAPGLQATQQSELGLTFAAAVFTKAPQRGHSQRQAGVKRGRPARQNGDASNRPRQQPRTVRTPAQVATLNGLLAHLLGSDYDAAAWQNWVVGPPTADAPCQIKHDQINYAELDKLEASSHRVLQSMHKHKAFEAEAWACMQPTMENLAAQVAAQSAYSDVAGDAGDGWASDEAREDKREYNVDFGGLSGLAPERGLPEGWRAPAAAHQQVKAADTQLRQGASLTQLHSFLLEFFDCLELDYDVCEAMNPGWTEAVPAMIQDIALMPAGTWAKYWRGAMLFLDWLVDPDCQADGPDAVEQQKDGSDDIDETTQDEAQQAEQVVQDKLAARFVTSSRFLRFVRAHEKGGPIDEAAASEVQLTEEQIQEAGKQFGIDLKDAHELLAMHKTMPRDAFRDWVNACGYLQIVQNALVKGQYEDRVNGLWKQAVVRRVEKQKRRLTGFLNKISLKDSTYRHLNVLTSSDLRQMALGFLKVSGRTDPWIALRAGAMYFYCIGMWTRAEDPRNRTYADLFPFTYPPSGRRDASKDSMECICASKDTGKTTSPTGHWEVQTFTHHKDWLISPIFWFAMWLVARYEAPGWKDVTPPLDVLAGRESGYGLQRLFSNAKTPYKSVSPATHGYQTDQARKRAGRTSLKNTYEPRSAIPNSLVLTFGTDLKWIEKAEWFSDLSTFDRHYEKVHHPDLVAQAAGHLDRDNYVSELGLNPEHMEEFRDMVALLWTTLKSQMEQIKQLNLSGDKRKRDLGGLLLLMVFMIARRTWWQLAPLLEELVAEHPIFTLGFMQEIRISGVWDRWVRVTKQYHQERKGMLKAAEGPVFSIAGLLPPHLIVARLLEPVHEALKNEPSAEDSVNSPVRHVSERQAHARQALDAISLTAQTLRQQQQSQTAPEGSASAAQHSNASTAGASQPWQQQQQQPQANARELAKKQVANVQQRMDQQGHASMPVGAPIDGVQAFSARAVLSRPPVNGVQIVYPGSTGEAYWCKWEGRFATLGQYASWELLMREWREGIRYSFGNKQTVPLQQLEKDLQEGTQQKSTASFKSEKEPWRRGITDRTAIMDRKIVIYGILKAQQDGHDLKEFMSRQIKRAETAMETARKAGVKRPPMLMNQLKRQFELAKDRLTPVQFEEQVRGWKLTAKVKAQAASKQQLPVYPPIGSAEAE
ncbi:hypothetical protein WJX79_006177, partial [Trebouxia sp. C0005]